MFSDLDMLVRDMFLTHYKEKVMELQILKEEE